jgi:hypothetical protein
MASASGIPNWWTLSRTTEPTQKRMPQPFIDEWCSTFWFPMSMTICAITAFFGSARAAGRYLPPTTPTDVKARILTTNIDLDEGTCSIDLVESVADYFGLNLPAAQDIIREVGQVVAGWRAVATAVGARSSEINRMASAFEHEDLTKARAM